jgi:branched-subunit amino acid ABC-type transport system permease component
MSTIKKVVSYILVGLVLAFTIITLLGIWIEDFNIEVVMKKSLFSLLVVFGASAVILFIFTVLIKDDENKPDKAS